MSQKIAGDAAEILINRGSNLQTAHPGLKLKDKIEISIFSFCFARVFGACDTRVVRVSTRVVGAALLTSQRDRVALYIHCEP